RGAGDENIAAKPAFALISSLRVGPNESVQDGVLRFAVNHHVSAQNAFARETRRIQSREIVLSNGIGFRAQPFELQIVEGELLHQFEEGREIMPMIPVRTGKRRVQKKRDFGPPVLPGDVNEAPIADEMAMVLKGQQDGVGMRGGELRPYPRGEISLLLL